MFRFEHAEHLWALVLIPILLAFYLVARYYKKHLLRKFGSSDLMARLMPSMSNLMHGLKFVFLLTAISLLVISWANPQWGSKKEKVKRKSVDVFIALDISQSMLAQDVPPNRLERAKRFAQDLIVGLKGERLGTIIFAGNAYLQVPLTTDYAAADLFIKSANPNMAPSQGTAIADAIDLAERSFEEDNKNHKALIIITDGENHDEEALERAKTANSNGLLIFTVGVGTEEGSFIPTFVGGRSDFKRDETGNPVRTKMNEAMMKDLAEAGDGNYFNLLGGSDRVMEILQGKINAMEKREFEQRVFTEYESYFQYFLGGALLFLLLEFFVSYRKNKYLENRDLFEV